VRSMAGTTIQRYVRPLSAVQKIMLARAKASRNPCDGAEYGVVERVLSGLTSLDRDAWARAFMAEAEPHEAAARRAEAAGDPRGARAAWLAASGLLRLARYPAANSPLKREAYERSKQAYLAATSGFDPPLERVEIPFTGRAGEGVEIVGYFRKPRGDGRFPLLLTWGGIDTFKEERRHEMYLDAGFAALTIDMPGVGDAPLAGSEDAERMWDPIFRWVASRDDVDPARVGVHALSTGGYWATKVAHTHHEYLRAVVNHGGCAHYAFTPAWLERAQHGEYPFELAETLASAFGRTTFEEWVDYAPRLSLLTQGVLEQPCAPLLCINGIEDSVFPIADHELLLRHGDAKTARFFEGGHMGHTPRTNGIILAWLKRELGVA
jgi:esterase FrsA